MPQSQLWGAGAVPSLLRNSGAKAFADKCTVVQRVKLLYWTFPHAMPQNQLCEAGAVPWLLRNSWSLCRQMYSCSTDKVIVLEFSQWNATNVAEPEPCHRSPREPNPIPTNAKSFHGFSSMYLTFPNEYHMADCRELEQFKKGISDMRRNYWRPLKITKHRQTT